MSVQVQRSVRSGFTVVMVTDRHGDAVTLTLMSRKDELGSIYISRTIEEVAVTSDDLRVVLEEWLRLQTGSEE